MSPSSSILRIPRGVLVSSVLVAAGVVLVAVLFVHCARSDPRAPARSTATDERLTLDGPTSASLLPARMEASVAEDGWWRLRAGWFERRVRGSGVVDEVRAFRRQFRERENVQVVISAGERVNFGEVLSVVDQLRTDRTLHVTLNTRARGPKDDPTAP